MTFRYVTLQTYEDVANVGQPEITGIWEGLMKANVAFLLGM